MNATSTVTNQSPIEMTHTAQEPSISESGMPDVGTATEQIQVKLDVKPHISCEICGKRLDNLIAVENHLVYTHNITKSVRFGKYFEFI